MKVLVLGASGLAGQAICKEARIRKYTVRTLARRNADILADVCDVGTLRDILKSEAPDVLVNCSALVDISMCETDPDLGWRINARPCATLAEWSRATGQPFIQVSTDHYYLEGGATAHKESEAVDFANDYAMQKFAGEAFALTAPEALVLRTSIVGIRGWPKPTFAEWAIANVRTNAKMTLFNDAYTSSIDVESFSRAAFDLLMLGARGLYNLASCQVYTKEAFVLEVAAQLGCTLDNANSGSINDTLMRRAKSLGLHVGRAEKLLGYKLPDLKEVVHSILNSEKGRSK